MTTGQTGGGGGGVDPLLPMKEVVLFLVFEWKFRGPHNYSELPLIRTPEMWPPLYSGHFETSQSMLYSTDSPLK